MEHYLVQFCCHGVVYQHAHNFVTTASSGNDAVYRFADYYIGSMGIDRPDWLNESVSDSSINYREKFSEYLLHLSNTTNAGFLRNAGYVRTCVCEEYGSGSAMLVYATFRKNTVIGFSSVPALLGEFAKAFDSIQIHEAIANVIEHARQKMPSLFLQKADLLDVIKDATSPIEAARILEDKAVCEANAAVSITVFVRTDIRHEEYIKLPETVVIGKYPQKTVSGKQRVGLKETPLIYFIAAASPDDGVNALVAADSPGEAGDKYRAIGVLIVRPLNTEITRVWGVQETSKAMMVCIVRVFIITGQGYRAFTIGQACENMDMRSLVEDAYKSVKAHCDEALSCEEEELSGAFDTFWSLGQVGEDFLAKVSPPGSIFTTKVYLRMDVDGDYVELPTMVAFDAYTPNLHKHYHEDFFETAYDKSGLTSWSGIATAQVNTTQDHN